MNPNRANQLQSIDPSPPRVLDHLRTTSEGMMGTKNHLFIYSKEESGDPVRYLISNHKIFNIGRPGTVQISSTLHRLFILTMFKLI